MATYEIRKQNSKQAIFDENGKQISDWFDEIIGYDFIINQSDYFIAIKNNKAAIFYKDGNRISKWFDEIRRFGLVKGKSEYYIAVENGKVAIFHKNGIQISDWFDDINDSGLVNGESEYFIAGKDGKEAIFYKDGTQISDWYNSIEFAGILINKESEYYAVKRKDYDTFIIFHKNGSLVNEFDSYFNEILMLGEKICLVKNKKNNLVYVIDRNGENIYDFIYEEGVKYSEKDILDLIEKRKEIFRFKIEPSVSASTNLDH